MPTLRDQPPAPPHNPHWCVLTGRLALRPIWGGDLADLTALKADPRVFAVMLGGVRSPVQVGEELAADIGCWGRHGFGMWSVRERAGNAFLGVAGILERPDGRGMALRFALRAGEHGQGYASEAAGAAVRFGHDRAGLRRVIAVARTTNFASRMVLGAIGMRECDAFTQRGLAMLVYESRR